MQGYIFPYISGRSSPNKYINKNFWGGSGQDKSIQKFQGGPLIMGVHGNYMYMYKYFQVPVLNFV